MKTLIYHTGALGDFISILPFVKRWNGVYPDSINTLLGKKPFGVIGIAATLLSDIWDIDSTTNTALFHTTPSPSTLKRLSGFNAAVLFTSNDSIIIRNCRAAGIPQILHHAPFPEQPISVIDYHLALLHESFDHKPFLSLPSITSHNVQTTDNTILIQPGSGSSKKNWPLEYFKSIAAIVKSKGFSVIWVTGPAEETMTIDTADQQLHNPDLPELGALLASCKGFIGNDSGVSHYAAALGCPCILLFGPSDHIVWAPPGPHVSVIVSPTKDMKDISVERVLEGCFRFFKSSEIIVP